MVGQEIVGRLNVRALRTNSDSRWVVRVPGVEIFVEKSPISGVRHFILLPMSSRWAPLHAIRRWSGRRKGCPLLANATAATTIHIAPANAHV
jgi:hypothetical protein